MNISFLLFLFLLGSLFIIFILRYLESNHFSSSSKTEEGDHSNHINASDHDHNTAQSLFKPNKTPVLVDDMIYEILLRLPIKSLLRFKVVCKNWHDVIKRSDFIKEHMNRATPVNVRNRDSITHSDFTTTANLHPDAAKQNRSSGFSILAVFEGLVVEQHYSILSVRNPATHKALVLPRLPTGRLSCEVYFNFDWCTGVATLLCEFDALNSESLVKETYFMILKIGKDEAWRTLRTYVRKELVMALEDRDAIHCIYTVQNGPGQILQVSSYNTRKESFFISDFPQDDFFANSPVLHPFWWNNSLAIGDISEEELRFLVLDKQHDYQEGNDKYKWSEKQIVVHLRFLEGNMDLREELVPVEASSDELWFHSQRNYLCYDKKAGILKEHKPLDGVKWLKYQPSLKKLEGMKEVDDSPYYHASL